MILRYWLKDSGAIVIKGVARVRYMTDGMVYYSYYVKDGFRTGTIARNVDYTMFTVTNA